MSFKLPNQQQPLRHLLQARCIHHWQETRHGNAWIDPHNATGWRHAKCGHQSHWEQLLVDVHGSQWWDCPAANLSAWQSAKKDFVEQVCHNWSLGGIRRQPGPTGPRCGATAAVPQWRSEDLQWSEAGSSFEFRVDNELVSSWLNGTAAGRKSSFVPRISGALDILQKLVQEEGWHLRSLQSDWVQWVPRERNCLADHLANKCLDSGRSFAVQRLLPDPKETNFIITSDGATRQSTQSSSASWAVLAIIDGNIKLVAAGAIKFVTQVTSTDAEMTGLELGLAALLKISRGYVNVVPHDAEFIADASELLKTIHPWLAVAL